MGRNFKYIYGPVFSWRLGVSLGIDPVSCEKKICTFDCVYCQLGRTKLFASKRKIFIPAKAILKEISSMPANARIDYFTFSGNGEPTLARNLGEIIKGIKKSRKEKVAIITNSSLIHRSDVQNDLLEADFVLLKLDANAEDLFMNINRPVGGIGFGDVIKGIKKFKSLYNGRLALQIMFIEKNKAYAKEIVKVAKKLGIKEVQLNTPLRECMEQPLSKPEMKAIKKYFRGMKISCVYDAKKKDVKPMDAAGLEKRHGRDKR